MEGAVDNPATARARADDQSDGPVAVDVVDAVLGVILP